MFVLFFCRWGERFISTTHIYNKEMRELAKKAAEESGLGPYLKEGVYCMVGGPNFETVAECRMLKLLGGDAVGKLQFKFYKKKYVMGSVLFMGNC